MKGKRQHNISLMCEVLGFTYESISFEAALSDVKQAVSGWTKDIRKEPAIDMRDVGDYLLKSHDTVTHTASRDTETVTGQNLRRYKTLRSYSLYSSGHVHSMVFLPMKESPSSCAIRATQHGTLQVSLISVLCCSTSYPRSQLGLVVHVLRQ